MVGAREPYDLLTYVWSDIFDLHLEYAGDESEHDQIVLRGRREDGAFTVLYLRVGALRAYFAVNGDSRELPILQRLIRTGVILVDREAQLQDRGFAIKGLL
jgi:hypothetical protein